MPEPDSTPPSAPAEDALSTLRALLFGQEQRRIEHLQQRLDDPQISARELRRVLPRALRVRPGEADLAQALEAPVAAALAEAVRRDPRPLSDALFPVMGPAIRRAIAAALRGMVQTLNQVIERSLTYRGWLWRLEAWRTGRPVAEVALLRSLVYRVEQVFLIHRETGLLLQHAALDEKTGLPMGSGQLSAAPSGSAQPAAPSMDHRQVVSGMLTAIQDFVQDSFRAGEGQPLSNLQVGELSVWIEHGPHALLAAVVRGTPPAALRVTLQQTLEEVQAEHGAALCRFSGDAGPLSTTAPLLEACLSARYHEPRRGGPAGPLLLLLLVLVPGVLLWLGYRTAAEDARWERCVARLRAEPGVVVTGASTSARQRSVSGLRDPLARPIEPVLAEAGCPAGPGGTGGQWQPYHALDERFVRERALAVLAPPPGVTVELQGGTLRVAGTAPHSWLEERLRLWPLLPGVTRVTREGLLDADQQALEEEARRLASAIVRFPVGSAAPFIENGTGLDLAGLSACALRLVRAARAVGADVTLEVVGHTDGSGDERLNRTLSLLRARAVAEALRQAGVPTQRLRERGVSAGERPLVVGSGPAAAAGADLRSVTFSVLHTH